MNTEIKLIELTPEQKSKWQDTLALFTWTCPGFRHLLYKLLTNNDGGNVAMMTDEIPVAATDAENVLINPNTFLAMPLKQRVFILAHEVVHNVYNDVDLARRLNIAKELRYPDGAVLPFDDNTLQIAMDLRINDLLVSSKVGELPTGEFAGHHDTNIATCNDAVYDIYRKIYEQDDGGGKGKGKGQGGQGQAPGAGSGNKGGFDKLLPPGASNGKDPSAPDAQRNNQAWATQMAAAQAIEAMKTQGNISADMQRLFDLYLKPQVPWTEHIRGFFARRLGSGSYDWRRPDRRLIVRDIYAPGRSGHGVGWVVVWGDTSGSISQKELDTYFAELAGLIADLNPKRVTVFWCDSQIKFTDEITDSADLAQIRSRGVGGGGGTSCKPVFRAVNKMSYEPPDAFVGLTDGLAQFPDKEPPYPTVWACTTDATIPFGEIIRIKAGA